MPATLLNMDMYISHSIPLYYPPPSPAKSPPQLKSLLILKTGPTTLPLSNPILLLLLFLPP